MNEDKFIGVLIFFILMLTLFVLFVEDRAITPVITENGVLFSKSNGDYTIAEIQCVDGFTTYHVDEELVLARFDLACDVGENNE